jgi:hypothetical protein
MDNLERKWLNDLFEYEDCDICGGDAEDHSVIYVLGNPFAHCTKACADYHERKGA